MQLLHNVSRITIIHQCQHTWLVFSPLSYYTFYFVRVVWSGFSYLFSWKEDLPFKFCKIVQAADLHMDKTIPGVCRFCEHVPTSTVQRTTHSHAFMGFDSSHRCINPDGWEKGSSQRTSSIPPMPCTYSTPTHHFPPCRSPIPRSCHWGRTCAVNAHSD